MGVRIRLKRLGRKNRPFYRVCVFDSRTQRDGRSIEDLGFYDTLAKDPARELKVDVERAGYWLSVGALPSEIVKRLFKRAGVVEPVSARARRAAKRAAASA